MARLRQHSGYFAKPSQARQLLLDHRASMGGR
jgi:hypothetical protein